MIINNVIHLQKPDIFSFSECLHFLDRGYDDCLYSIDGNRVIKPLQIEGDRILIEVSNREGYLEAKLLSGEASQAVLEKAAKYVVQWFDLERDLQPYYLLLNQHQQFAYMRKKYNGLRLMGIPDLFEALCWCVIGQQINLTFAHRLKRQLVETYGSFITYNSRRHYFFPDPEVLANLKTDDLKDLQFSRQKSEYLIGIAKDFADGKITKQNLNDLNSRQQMLDRLKKIRGVGDWTANYVLMKSLKQMNCITYGDTGLQTAVSSMLEFERKPTRQEVEMLFKPFAGWESYLVIYLWRTLS
jgi:DNA-3-methyladenine glycosylase II